MSEPADDLVQAIRAFAAADLDMMVANGAGEGVPDAARIRSEFDALLTKWVGIVADVDSQDAYREALWTNVFGMINPATYAN